MVGLMCQKSVVFRVLKHAVTFVTSTANVKPQFDQLENNPCKHCVYDLNKKIKCDI